MNIEQTPHEVLSIYSPKSNSAEDIEDIKKAYRKKAKEYHPDKNPGDPNATANFQKINNANQILQNSQERRKSKNETRKIRDKQKKEERNRQQRPASAPPRPRTQTQPQPSQPQKSTTPPRPRTQTQPRTRPSQPQQSRTQPPPPPPPQSRTQPPPPPPPQRRKAWGTTPQNHGDRTSQKQREKAAEQRRKDAAYSAKYTRKTGQRPHTANTHQNPVEILKEISKIEDEINKTERDILNNESMKEFFRSTEHGIDEKIDNNIYLLKEHIRKLTLKRDRLETERKSLIEKKSKWVGGKNKTKKSHNDS